MIIHFDAYSYNYSPCAGSAANRQTGSVLRHPTRSRLVVATPPLEDPNFDRSVVYMIEHSEEGAIGVVLNRPLTDDLEEPLDRWTPQLADPAVLHDGGPVDPDAMIALARPTPATPEEVEGALKIADGVWSVDLSGDPALIAPNFAGVRVFRGYAGWGPGQLDAEIDAGAWIVTDAMTDDLFGQRPQELWRIVLSRQPGRLAWLAQAPDDLSLN